LFIWVYITHIFGGLPGSYVNPLNNWSGAIWQSTKLPDMNIIASAYIQLWFWMHTDWKIHPDVVSGLGYLRV
jgi:hypothetical protein